MLLNDLLPDTVWQIFFIFARVGGMVMSMTGAGEAYVPGRAKLGLALLIAVVLTPPLLDVIPPLPDSPLTILVLVSGEIVIGLFFGLLSQLLMSSLQVAGTIIAFQIGLANAFIFNPATAQQSSIFGAFLGATGLLLIFAADLHHLLFIALRDSYELFPPGQLAPVGDFANHYAETLAQTFTIAMQMATPFVFVGLIFYLMLGIVARLMPQIQIFFVALPLQLMIGTLVFLPSLSIIGTWFMEYFETSLLQFISP